MQKEEDITGRATYDQTVGFMLKETIDFKALYVCSSSSQGVQYSFVPLDKTNRIQTKLSLRCVSDPARAASVWCTTAEPLQFTLLTIAPCPSLTQCDLKFRPHYVKFQFFDTKGRRILNHD